MTSTRETFQVTARKPLILITGATATGKTGLAISLALKCQSELSKIAEVVNGDSLLFYDELSIGTARPTPEEMQGVQHHLVGHQSVESPLNASQYCEQALPIIEKLHQEEKIPIIVGGSAFYIRALIKGMYESGESDPKARETLEDLEKKEGWQAIRLLLKEKDPQSFATIHENDRYRTMRALEYFLSHQSPISAQREKIEENGPYDFTNLRDSSWELHHIYLEVPKDAHWDLMKKRAQTMLKDGLLKEVQGLLDAGISTELKALQSIGYKETIEFLNSAESDEEALVEKIYINTRRLAKSQKTFFKKITPKISYNPLEDQSKIEEDFFHFLKELEGR